MIDAQLRNFFTTITRDPKLDAMRIFGVILKRWRLDICRGDGDRVEAFAGGDSQLLVSAQGNYIWQSGGPGAGLPSYQGNRIEHRQHKTPHANDTQNGRRRSVQKAGDTG